MKTNQILEEFSSLPPTEKERFIEDLIDQWENDEGQMACVIKELEETRISLPSCVHCKSDKTLRRAKIKGIQRYSCKSCGKYWMATQGTSLSGLRKKSLWQNYIKAFLRGLSIRKAALEVGVCIQTSFRWRHRLLSSISCYLPQSIGGIIESTDFPMPFSRKGERGINTTNKESGTSPDQINIIMSVCRGKPESLSSVIKASSLNEEQINKAISGKILHGSVHITNENLQYGLFKNSKVIEHLSVKIKTRPRKRELIHIKTAIQSQQAFLNFLQPFHGVATKYLPNYLNWHHFKEFTQKRFDKVKQIMQASLAGDQAQVWLEDITINDTIIIT